jgi:hypothetical protein
MMTRRRRQRNSLPEIDFVAVKNYRRAPAESESKNDIEGAPTVSVRRLSVARQSAISRA